MKLPVRNRARALASISTVTAFAVLLAACGAGRTDGGGDGGGSGSIIVGTTDKVVALDPAGSYDQGSSALQAQVFQTLFTTEPGTAKVVPDAAQSCSFVQPTIYECVVKSGLKFANGNPLDANAVKFSFDRILKINDPNGPASLLENLVETTVKDPQTVDFRLKKANDQTFQQVITANPGPIMDPKTISPDKVTTAADIVAAKAFSGPYSITSYADNNLVELTPNAGYDGALGKPKNTGITLKYFDDGVNMKLALQNGTIDVASRAISPTDVPELKKDSKLTVVDGPGGNIIYLTFNMNTMPGGTPAQKLAIRKALASSVDRQAITSTVYKDTAQPLYSMVASQFPGSVPSFKNIYGEAPNLEAAKKFLADAGVSTPVTLNLQYTTEHYGAQSPDAFAALKTQLDKTGLFNVNIKGTEWVTYSKERVADVYPIYQLGWFPDFADADNYLTPFLSENNFLKNHFSDPGISDLLSKESSEPDAAARQALMAQIQNTVAAELHSHAATVGARTVCGHQHLGYRCGSRHFVQVPVRLAGQAVRVMTATQSAAGPPPAGAQRAEPAAAVFRSRRSALARYLAVRALLIIPTVWILVTVVFFVMRVLGDPIAAHFSQLTEAQIQVKRQAAGYDRPLLVQYWDYLSGLLTGNFGQATTSNQQVSTIIVQNGAATLELAFWALLVAFIVGIPLGRYAATHRDGAGDLVLRFLAVLFYAAPVFFVGILLKLLFGVKLGWLPINGRASTSAELALQNVSPKTNIMIIDAFLYGDTGYIFDVLQHAILPALALGLLTAGVFLRLVRINLIQTMQSGYVDAARARGLPNRLVVGRHAFRNALIPVVTVIGMQIAMLLGGAVLTETTFEWRGLGYQLAFFLKNTDYVAVQGIVAFIAIVIAVMSFVIDVVVSLVDPRVRF